MSGKKQCCHFRISLCSSGIIRQSFYCQERHRNPDPKWAYEVSSLNGDGFGVGWYIPMWARGHRALVQSECPCVFTSLKPAWSDRNLVNLAESTLSPLTFAHVRAAGPGSGWPSEMNCHPFSFGRFLFMHNGVVGEWKRVRGRFLSLLSVEASEYVLSTGCIDSVVIFGILISQLTKGAFGDYDANELRLMVERTLAIIEEVCREEQIQEVSLLNILLTDGKCVLSTRHVVAPFGENVDGFEPASLYFATGTHWGRDPDTPDSYRMVHLDKRNDVAIITSEPLTDNEEEWVPIPKNHLLIITPRMDVVLCGISRAAKILAQMIAQNAAQADKALKSHQLLSQIKSNENTSFLLSTKNETEVKAESMKMWLPNLTLVREALRSKEHPFSGLLLKKVDNLQGKFEWIIPNRMLSHETSSGISSCEDLSYKRATREPERKKAVIKPIDHLSAVDKQQLLPAQLSQSIKREKVGCLSNEGQASIQEDVVCLESSKETCDLRELEQGQRQIGAKINSIHTTGCHLRGEHKDFEITNSNTSPLLTASATCNIVSNLQSIAQSLNSLSNTVTNPESSFQNVQMASVVENRAEKVVVEQSEPRSEACKQVTAHATSVAETTESKNIVREQLCGSNAKYEDIPSQNLLQPLVAQHLDNHQIRITPRLLCQLGGGMSFKDHSILTGSLLTAIPCRQLVASKGRAILSVACFSIWPAVDDNSKVKGRPKSVAVQFDEFAPCRYVITGDQGGKLRVWDLSNGVCLKTFSGIQGGVLSLALVYVESPSLQNVVKGDLEDYSKGHLLLFAGSSDTTITVWDLSLFLKHSFEGEAQNLKENSISGPENNPILCISFSPIQGDVLSLALHRDDAGNAAIYAGFQTTLIGYLYLNDVLEFIRKDSAAQCESLTVARRYSSTTLLLKGHEKKWRNYCFANVTNNEATQTAMISKRLNGACTRHDAIQRGCNDCRQNLSSRSDGQLECHVIRYGTIARHCGFIESLVSCGPFLCSGGGDGLILVWRNNQPVKTLVGHRGGILCLAAAHEPELGLYSGSRDKSIRAWDLETLSCRQTLKGHTSDVLALALTKLYLVSGSANGEVFCWDRRSHVKLSHLLTASPLRKDVTSNNVSITSICVVPSSVVSPKSHLCESDPASPCENLCDRLRTEPLESSAFKEADAKSKLKSRQAAYPNTTTSRLSENSIARCLSVREECEYSNLLEASSIQSSPEDIQGNVEAASKVSAANVAYSGIVMERGDDMELCASNLRGDYSVHDEPISSDRMFQTIVECEIVGAGGDGILRLWRIERPQQVQRSLIEEAALSLADVKQKGCRLVPTNEIGGCLTSLEKENALTSPTDRLTKLISTDRCNDLEALLREFISIQSISGRPIYLEECWRAARFLCGCLDAIGAAVKLIDIGTGRAPLVAARLGSDPKKPTVLFYSHYDVVPATASWSQLGSSNVSEISSRREVNDELSYVSPQIYSKLTRHMSVETEDSLSPSLDALVIRTSCRPPNVHLASPNNTCVASTSSQHQRNSHWQTDPWQLTAVNGYFYGRGVTDNKGPLLAQIFAVVGLQQALHRSASSMSEVVDKYEADLKDPEVPNLQAAKLPVNVVWLSEGEEESGSYNFESTVHRLQESTDFLTGVSCVVCTNSYWMDDRRPCIVAGMRGVIDITLTVSGGIEPFGHHSGVHGGAIAEPMLDLLAVVASLVDASGRVQIPHFYEDVDTGLELDESFLSEEFLRNEFVYKKQVNNAGLRDTEALEGLKRRWLQPVLSVTEVWSSNQDGATSDLGQTFRVIPSKASCNISIRCVPNQNLKKLIKQLENHVFKEFNSRKSPNNLTVNFANAFDWWTGDIHSQPFKAAFQAVEKVWNIRPLIVREGGTMPVIRFLQDALRVPAIHLPIGQASDAAHLPNERIRIINLKKGIDALQQFFLNLAN